MWKDLTVSLIVIKNSLAAKLSIMTFFHRSSICRAAGKLIGAGQYSRGETYCEYWETSLVIIEWVTSVSHISTDTASGIKPSTSFTDLVYPKQWILATINANLSIDIIVKTIFTEPAMPSMLLPEPKMLAPQRELPQLNFFIAQLWWKIFKIFIVFCLSLFLTPLEIEIKNIYLYCHDVISVRNSFVFSVQNCHYK